jgi:hypothetical protein
MEQTISPDEVRTSKKDIESHSSYKTNEMVSELLMEVARAEAMALDSRMVPEYAIQYGNRILGLMKFVHVAIDDEESSELYNHLNLINSTIEFIVMNQASKSMIDINTVIELNRVNQEAYWLIMQALQNHQYLFRVGEREPKTLDAMLTIFREQKVWQKNKNIGKHKKRQEALRK